MANLKCSRRGCKKPCVTVEDGVPLCEDHCDGWLTKKLRDPEFAAAYQRECENDAAFAAAQAAVVKAAMRFWTVGKMEPDEWHANVNAADAEFDAACAALKKLGG